MPKVLINAGHHDKDVGVVWKKIIERDEVKKIRDNAVKYLKEFGIEVIEVPDNLNLRKSIDFANNHPCDLALDIHLNNSGSVPKTERGTEVYGNDNLESHSQANILSEILANYIEIPSRGWKSQTISVWGSLAWISQINYPSYLIECLYISHPEDRFLIENKQHDKIGKGIALAVTRLFNLPKENVLTPVPNVDREKENAALKLSLQSKILELSAKVVLLMQQLLKVKNNQP